MGKKRKEEDRDIDDIPPDVAPASESKKTKNASFHKLSLETLRETEKEATAELNSLQAELNRQRANRVTTYGDNNLRNMNTKRNRAAFVLGEIKAEIERRKVRKAGNAIPEEGIVAGSSAGEAATKWDHYYEGKALTAKQREEKAFAEKRALGETQAAPTLSAIGQPGLQDPWANAWAATAKAASQAMGAVPSAPSSCGATQLDFAMLARQGAGMAPAHMGAMHHMNQEMPAAMMQNLPTGMPAFFANTLAGATNPSSNIPAAFRNRKKIV